MISIVAVLITVHNTTNMLADTDTKWFRIALSTTALETGTIPVTHICLALPEFVQWFQVNGWRC